ncbi:MAG: sugar transferase [Ruminococcaceae bacterium]|nr:sugar transferase [Oscillospiraceae bacterium]
MYARAIKRIIDLVLAIVGIIVLALPMLIVAIIIKIESKGPAIFVQERVGKGGKVYKMYKFRSMCVGAEQQEGGVYCVKGDKRVTKVGKFIRATSIDELPQLVNIIKGEMSFIGPRPVLTYYPKQWEEYTEEELRRFDARPGVTGWAAVHGRKTNTVKARFEYDNYYVDNLTFGLDVKIFFMTIKTVFTNEGNEDDGSSEVKTEEAKTSVEISEAENNVSAAQEIAMAQDADDIKKS